MADSSKTILIVDDEASIRRLLRRCFEGAGFETVEAATGDEMFSALAKTDISLITLDIGLGSQDGLELARKVRMSHQVPIIMVTGKGDLIDTVVGLEVGADDYIAKPFELREVLARVRAVLRRYENGSVTPPAPPVAPDSTTKPQTEPEPDQAAGSSYQFNNWVLNTSSRELYDADNKLSELTTAQYELLVLLVTHPRQVLSRDKIMDLLKGCDWSPTDRTIDNQISRLRRKLNQPESESQLIKTVRGAGYMFNAQVEKT